MDANRSTVVRLDAYRPAKAEADRAPLRRSRPQGSALAPAETAIRNPFRDFL
jgi:hypothetical protein